MYVSSGEGKTDGDRNLFCISNNISTPRRLFCNNHENKYFISILPWQQIKQAGRFPLEKNEVGQSVTSYFNKTAEKASS